MLKGGLRGRMATRHRLRVEAPRVVRCFEPAAARREWTVVPAGSTRGPGLGSSAASSDSDSDTGPAQRKTGIGSGLGVVLLS